MGPAFIGPLKIFFKYPGNVQCFFVIAKLLFLETLMIMD